MHEKYYNRVMSHHVTLRQVKYPHASVKRESEEGNAPSAALKSNKQ